MRFDDLFADLEDQASSDGARELWDEAGELARAETASRTLAQRLQAGLEVRLELQGGARVRGVVLRSGPDWLALRCGAELWLIRSQAIMRASFGPASPIAATDTPRLDGGGHARVRGLASGVGSGGATQDGGGELPVRRILRSLARSRAVVRIEGVDGERIVGRLRALGVDYAELSTERGTLAVALHAVTAFAVAE